MYIIKLARALRPRAHRQRVCKDEDGHALRGGQREEQRGRVGEHGAIGGHGARANEDFRHAVHDGGCGCVGDERHRQRLGARRQLQRQRVAGEHGRGARRRHQRRTRCRLANEHLAQPPPRVRRQQHVAHARVVAGDEHDVAVRKDVGRRRSQRRRRKLEVAGQLVQCVDHAAAHGGECLLLCARVRRRRRRRCGGPRRQRRRTRRAHLADGARRRRRRRRRRRARRRRRRRFGRLLRQHAQQARRHTLRGKVAAARRAQQVSQRAHLRGKAFHSQRRVRARAGAQAAEPSSHRAGSGAAIARVADGWKRGAAGREGGARRAWESFSSATRAETAARTASATTAAGSRKKLGAARSERRSRRPSWRCACR